MSRATSIVDDTDESIQYSGSWVARGPVSTSSEEYNRTSHRSVTAGDSLKYIFRGTGISVYGTLVYPMNGAPVSSFILDNGPAIALNSTGDLVPHYNSSFWSHALFFNTSALGDAEHTLTINVDQASTTFPFHFDFLTITNAGGKRNVILDDVDPAIVYTGGWANNGSYKEYMGTTHKSPPASGGTATLQFNGTAIAVYGTVENEPWSQMNFTMDSSAPTVFVPPIGGTIPRHGVIYSTDGLSPGIHDFTITNLNDSPFYVDYFIYNTNEAQQVSSAGSSTLYPGTSSSTPNQSSASTSSPPIGAIVGGVIAAVALIICVALLFYFMGRRRKRNEHHPVSFTTFEKSTTRKAVGKHVMTDPSSIGISESITSPPSTRAGERYVESDMPTHSDRAWPDGLPMSEKSSRNPRRGAILPRGTRAPFEHPARTSLMRSESRDEPAEPQSHQERQRRVSQSWSGSEAVSPCRIGSPPPAYVESGAL